ncbi:MAG: proliferating cell nuclear antigen (pcna) [Candidatus Micrarchaeia archaeon]
MVEVVVGDARFWKSCIDAIVSLIEEGVMEFGEDGVSLKAMDPSQIAMVCFAAPKQSFASYHVEAPTKLGLSFSNLSRFLARARTGERLTMRTEENRLVLEFSGGEEKRAFKVPLIDIPAGPQKEPRVEHEASVRMRAGLFKEILRDAELVSSHLTLLASEKGLAVDAHGDAGDLYVESERTAGAIEEIVAKKAAKATFPLTYLANIVKACPDERPLTLHLKSNAPIKVEYSLDGAHLVYYLAPRIDVE